MRSIDWAQEARCHFEPVARKNESTKYAISQMRARESLRHNRLGFRRASEERRTLRRT